MNELDKIRRVASRAMEGAPHEVAARARRHRRQNGLQQAREFTASRRRDRHRADQGSMATAKRRAWPSRSPTNLKLPIRYVASAKASTT